MDKQLTQYLLTPKVRLEDAQKLLKILMSEFPEKWISLPRHKRPTSWSNIGVPVVHLERNLYGHPLAGLMWEGQLLAANAKPCQFEAQLYIFEDNEAVIKIIIKDRRPTVRRVSQTHRVAFDWLFDRINLDQKIQIRYVDTKTQLADMLTKGSFSRDEWGHLFRLLNIMKFLIISVGATQKLLGLGKSHAKTVAWSYDVEGHAKKCVWKDLANWPLKQLSNYTKSRRHAWTTINLEKKKMDQLDNCHSLLTNCLEMLAFGQNW